MLTIKDAILSMQFELNSGLLLMNKFLITADKLSNDIFDDKERQLATTPRY